MACTKENKTSPFHGCEEVNVLADALLENPKGVKKIVYGWADPICWKQKLKGCFRKQVRDKS